MRSQTLTKSYYSLVNSTRKSSSGCVTPSDLKNLVSKVARQFSGYGQ